MVLDYALGCVGITHSCRLSYIMVTTFFLPLLHCIISVPNGYILMHAVILYSLRDKRQKCLALGT